MQEQINKKQIQALFERINAMLNDSDLHAYEIDALGLKVRLNSQSDENIPKISKAAGPITMCNPTWDPRRKVWYCG